MKLRTLEWVTIVNLGFALLLNGCATSPRRHPAADDDKEKAETACPFDQYDKNWKSELLIYHFYVGQGDSTFIRTPSGTTILIDAGLEGQGHTTIMPVFKQCGIASLDYGVLTHPHIDHFGGWLDFFKDKFPINKAFLIPSLYDENGKNSHGKWQHFKDQANAVVGKDKVIIPKLGTQSIVDEKGDVTFDLVAVGCRIKDRIVNACFRDGEHIEAKDNNSLSIAQVIHYKSFAYWAGGDLTAAGQGNKKGKPDVESLVAEHVAHVDVYHANHHGSDSSSSEALLQVLKPDYAVISAGIGGTNGDNTKVGGDGDAATKFHLPDEGSLVRMSSHNVQAIYMTSKGETEDPDHTKAIDVTHDANIKARVVDADQNDVMLVTDGETFSFHGKNISGKDEEEHKATGVALH